MNILYAMLGGFALDWIFGDPAWLTHPVVIMGLLSACPALPFTCFRTYKPYGSSLVLA